MIIFLSFFGLGFFFVLHWRHSALPLEELAESRLVAEAQHFGYLLHGKGRVAQADLGFTDKHSRQDSLFIVFRAIEERVMPRRVYEYFLH